MSTIKTIPYTWNMGAPDAQRGIRINGDHGFLFVADNEILTLAHQLADHLEKQKEQQ